MPIAQIKAVKIDEIKTILDVSRSTVENLIRAPDAKFPSELPRNGRERRWRKDEVEAYKLWGPDWLNKLIEKV